MYIETSQSMVIVMSGGKNIYCEVQRKIFIHFMTSGEKYVYNDVQRRGPKKNMYIVMSREKCVHIL